MLIIPCSMNIYDQDQKSNKIREKNTNTLFEEPKDAEGGLSLAFYIQILIV